MYFFAKTSLRLLLTCLTVCAVVCHNERAAPAQETISAARSIAVAPHAEAIPRASFFAIETLPEETRELSQKLLAKALDGEAFYTLVGQLKPVSEGFWGGYYTVDGSAGVDDSADPNEPAKGGALSEVKGVRAALAPWNIPEIFFADVLLYGAVQNGQRYASAYVVHLPSLRKLIEEQEAFFTRLGITVDTPPGEVMLMIERCRQPGDRWRGLGLVFGYPRHAIDFFVEAGMHQRTTGEFIERDFRQIPTRGSRTGRFVYAVPKLSQLQPEDIRLRRDAARLFAEHRRLREDPLSSPQQAGAFLRDWMDNGNGVCHPDHLIAKLPLMTDAELDAEIASWENPEPSPPKTSFSHLYLVLSQAEFDVLVDSEFVRDQLATTGRNSLALTDVNDQNTVLLLQGRDTYLQILSPGNEHGHPVGSFGVSLSVARSVEREQPERVITMQSINAFRVDEIPSISPQREAGEEAGHELTDESAPRKDSGEQDDHQNKLMRNITSLTVAVPRDAAAGMRTEFEKLGWSITEFDSRTWILRGPEFRLLLSLVPEGRAAKVASIGFKTDPGTESIESLQLSNYIDLSVDGAGAGWLDFTE